MATKKLCFVIMPIGTEGSDDHKHFKALFEIIRFIITTHSQEYDVQRVDEVAKAGSITKEIVLQLARADLVIADLSGLNPNVFYELGIRHSLFASGTVMILDKLRTERIPFDLSAYNVLHFSTTMAGQVELREKLTAFLVQLPLHESERRDNPVHDWLPALPANVLASASGSNEGQLREKLAKALRQVSEYEAKLGVKPGGGALDTQRPLDVINSLLEEASQGLLPSDLLQQAATATNHRDKKRFLEIVKCLLEKPATRVAPADFNELARLGRLLSMNEVVLAIYAHACGLYPENRELKNSQLGYLTSSDSPEVRNKARQEILSVLRMNGENNAIVIRSEATVNDYLFGVMLDAFHADELHSQALEIAQLAAEKFPHMCKALRNRGRALIWLGRKEEGLACYRRALACEDRDDLAANWMGTALNNAKRYVDSLEAYALACILDAEDASGFINVADEIVRYNQAQQLAQAVGGPGQTRLMPEEIDHSVIEMALTAAFSCPSLSQKYLDAAKRIASRAQMDADQALKSAGEPGGRMNTQMRLEFAAKLYARLRSKVTDSHPELESDSAAA